MQYIYEIISYYKKYFLIGEVKTYIIVRKNTKCFKTSSLYKQYFNREYYEYTTIRWTPSFDMATKYWNYNNALRDLRFLDYTENGDKVPEQTCLEYTTERPVEEKFKKLEI